jgi:predicted nuclease of predicted toxin-antitoxin system
MKLLFDENLSYRLVTRSADDLTVWTYAKDKDLIICSKDSDMPRF